MSRVIRNDVWESPGPNQTISGSIESSKLDFEILALEGSCVKMDILGIFKVFSPLLRVLLPFYA